MKIKIDEYKTPPEIEIRMSLAEFCRMWGALYANHHASIQNKRVRVEHDVYEPLAAALEGDGG